MLVVKFSNRLPTSIITAPSVYSLKRQLDSAREDMFAEFPWFPPVYAIPTPNSLSHIIVSRSLLFSFTIKYYSYC